MNGLCVGGGGGGGEGGLNVSFKKGDAKDRKNILIV